VNNAIVDKVSPSITLTGIRRAYFDADIAGFLACSTERVLGQLTAASEFAVEVAQRDAWVQQIEVLREALGAFADRGHLYLEFVVPRVGKRIDAIALIEHTVFVIEFKVGAPVFLRQDLDQAWDYALDLKNFHETSHAVRLLPILVITGATGKKENAGYAVHSDEVLRPVAVSADRLAEVLHEALGLVAREPVAAHLWDQGRYKPTPTIIEAAAALYRRHSVAEIARSDAGAANLARTSGAVAQVIERSRREGLKSICLVTGVPGAGKTLVGLDIATRYLDAEKELHSVYLSGNGPLVSILREALARDEVARAKAHGTARPKGSARQAVKGFIQPIHHFRDDCLNDPKPPTEHVTIFDEAQRAWTREKTADFMRRKKGRPDFDKSEPAFLISCLDRHADWAVVVCLIGGGQEINTGEAGISEWIDALQSQFPTWHVHLSPQLQDSEYAAAAALLSLEQSDRLSFDIDLHLATSMRSFRAEHLSGFVKQVLDLEMDTARTLYAQLAGRYPVVLPRDVNKARRWLRQQARGTERYGIVVSSQAQRLKPHALDVRSPVDPVNWFLNDRDDVRSSYYLEDVATEFHVQGLELDWTCVVWDADLRHGPQGWQHHEFFGTRWQRIRKPDRQRYLKNAYRVLLTRARQGMVIVVPEGAEEDDTRRAEYYDGTFNYLRGLGLPLV
jgi:hypothetical protein